MQKKNKEIDRLLSDLRQHCNDGDIAPLSTRIAKFMGSYLIKRFIEQKLILRVPSKFRRHVARTLLSCSEKLNKCELNWLTNYLEFSISVDILRQKLHRQLHKKIEGIGKCNNSDALGLARHIYTEATSGFEKAVHLATKAPKVAEQEHNFHNLNGRIVDYSNALARTVNELGQLKLLDNRQSSYKRRDRKRALSAMIDAVTLAGQLNAIDWIFDEVSFGHFIVNEKLNNGLDFKLDFAHPKVALMRRLATRRALILKYTGARHPRYIRGALFDVVEPLLGYAIDYYCDIYGVSSLNTDDIRSSLELAKRSLVIIDAEDDLLYAAGKGDHRIQAYYVSGMALTCFAIASNLVRGTPQENRKRTSIIGVPLTIVSEIIHSIVNIEESLIIEGLQALSTEIPSRSHHQLNAMPFVRDENNLVMPFLNGYSGMWNTMVRNALIKGGKIGKEYGALWEMFLEHSFNETKWKTVGKGIKLRRNKQIITDVDLLLKREDLLLVVQIKALIGSADTPYDHWKNRQVIEYGCSQARDAVDFLSENSEVLNSICGKKISHEIRVIQPVVLTNRECKKICVSGILPMNFKGMTNANIRPAYRSVIS